MDYDAILRRTRRRLVDDHGMVPVRTFEDRGGIHCVLMKKDGDQFYVVAKKQVWEDTASLLQKTVRRAAGYDSLVACYFLDMDDVLVFDARYVLQEGKPKRAKSKTHLTDWFEVPVHTGVTLESYLLGRDRPARIRKTVDTGLDRYL